MDSRNSHKSNHIDVAPETIHNLHKLAQMCGYKTIGKVVDKLVREKMCQLEGVFDLCERLDKICEEEEDDDV